MRQGRMDVLYARGDGVTYALGDRTWVIWPRAQGLTALLSVGSATPRKRDRRSQITADGPRSHEGRRLEYVYDDREECEDAVCTAFLKEVLAA